MTLIHGLPNEARINRPDERERERLTAEAERWSRTEQLLALLIEVVSIKVAGKGLKKPVEIDRPGKTKKPERITGRRDPRRDASTPAVEAPTPAPAALQDTAGSARKAVASSQQPHDPTRDAAFKQGIAMLRSTAKPRKG